MNIQPQDFGKAGTRSLDGKVAVVTGSTSGIGLGIARALAAQGASVVLNGFGGPEQIAGTQWQLAREFGVEVVYSPADMTSATAIGEMIEFALGISGRLDVLVNNAGIQH